MINLDIDFGPIDAYISVADAHARVMTSSRSQSQWTIAMGMTAASAFNEWIDSQAESMPARLGHVYEWGQIGKPQGHLWRNILVGAGNTRILDFKWKQSFKVVPVGENSNRLAGGGSPIEGDTRRAIHVFRWKAPMTENGTPVSVTPQNSPVLAFPIGSVRGGQRGNGTGMAFSQGTVNPKINTRAKGQFGMAWTLFFTSIAVNSVDAMETGQYEEFMKVDFTNKVVKRIKSGRAAPKRAGIKVNVKTKDMKSKANARSITNQYFAGKVTRAATLAKFQGMDEGE